MKQRNIILVAIIVVSIALTSVHYAKGAGKPYKVGVSIILGTQAFKDEMTKLGYVEGQDITYLEPAPIGNNFEEYLANYSKYIQAALDAKADAIVVNNDSDAASLAKQTTTIPIIFARSDNPVATGAVKSLITPGGNVTGVITNKAHERRLQLLTEIKPSTKKVYYFYSTLTAEAQAVLDQVTAVGKQLNVEVVPAPISDPQSMSAVLDKVPDDIDWFFMTPYVFFDPPNAQKLVQLSISHHAGIAAISDLIQPGDLIGYGPNYDATGRDAARLLDQVLRGASPANLPVVTAENFFSVNLEAAQSVQQDIPLAILRQANLIIRPGDFAKTPQPSFGAPTVEATESK